ncbi:hypothetical protein CERSUDRAFT_83652 [Gelatoporia subvermispora B]|uniref:Uncharacterized protein n=1 Tax=Ceriporiopsis subvermispora (strain B) TaxID=914234 RepID=M2PN97_CERS8|nr:hypothetical protein CERSUDRAFT_83652 [Gelatoporia subvermispora B]
MSRLLSFKRWSSPVLNMNVCSLHHTVGEYTGSRYEHSGIAVLHVHCALKDRILLDYKAIRVIIDR